MKLVRGIGEVLTLQGVALKDGIGLSDTDLTPLKSAAMVIDPNGAIAWLGKESDLDSKWASEVTEEVHLDGRVVTPAFCECHTHLVFAGSRVGEFDLRAQGVSYQEIARRGGGILSTVTSTREAPLDRLLEIASKRVRRFVEQGVTTLEIKSGYGLELAAEKKMLEVIRRLQGPRVVATLLAPHAVPPEAQSPEAYLRDWIQQHLPKLVGDGLVDRVDMFIEAGFFTPEHAAMWFSAARALGVQVTAHVEQLSHQGGAVKGVENGADSLDHLVEASEGDIKAMALAGTTAVLLPAADLYLKIRYPRARKMIEEGVRVALATDFNPGSSPTQDLSLIGVLARIEMKMSLAEVLAAYTYNAARALGKFGVVHGHNLGVLQDGASADFVVLSDDWRSLFYSIGYHPVAETWISGSKLKFS